MSDGITSLDEKIDKFEDLLRQMREETREGHSILKAMQKERKEIEKLLKDEPTNRVHEEISSVVVAELAKIGPEISERTSLIYEKVGKEIDKIIELSLGKEMINRTGGKDLRPILAVHLRAWIQEVMDEVQL